MEKSLNKAQKQAVEHKNGPLLIIAGAGTGKTTVVTERIKHLIFSGFANPSEVLGLTFTEKAAREMQERVDIALPLGYTQMAIGTFHSFCDGVLRDEALNIGYDPKFRLMTESENIQLLRTHLFSFNLQYFTPLGNPTKFLDAMVNHFARLQDENITPNEYLDWVNANLKKQISKTFVQAISDLKGPKEVEIFFNDFLTESEIDTYAKRLAVAYWLRKGRSYSNIKENLKVSSATIASVQDQMSKAGIKLVLKKMEAEEWANQWADKIAKVLPLGKK